MKNVASYFNIGPDASQFAAVTFNSYSTVEFNLNTYSTLSSLKSGIDNINYPGGGTRIVPALNLAKSRLNPSSGYGARPASEGVPKIAIIMTDGIFGDYTHDITTRSAELRNQGVVVYAIGVAGARIDQLNRVASDPDSDHVFFLSSFNDISGFVDTMSAVTCSAPAIIEPGDNTTTGVDNGNTKYFQTMCNTFSTKVIVDLLDITGTSHLYVSSIVTNPGPLTPNTQRNETANTNRRHAEVTLQSNKVVYIGVQGQTQMATFTIIVWDNLFSPADVYQNLLEGQYPGRTVIRASDSLVSGARGNQYTYSFIEGSGGEGIFSIDSNGHVTYSINGPGVSYSRKRHHNLIVQAQNVHQPCQRARIRILITVFRNSILFNNIGPLSISENANTGLFVTQVVGMGGTGSIVYSLVASNSYFSLDSANGVIRLIRTLNYEVQASHTLSVRAQSTGDIVVSSTKSINIQVLDENEQKVFTTSCARTSSGCVYSINENSPPTRLGQISVSDPDLSSQPTGQNIYSLSPNGVPFSVDSVGNIRSTASLDRETASSYTFNLNVADTCASHCRMTITTRITVNVLDLNDNKPIFSSNPSVLQVREDQSQNSIIAQYSAYDRDTGANAVIAYSLSPSGTPFSLTGGTLRLVGSIDFEITESYSITVTASNPGSSQSTSTSTTIQIINLNDNRPIFTGTPYSAMLKENRPSGTSVIDVSATDADKGLPGQLEYLITSGNTLSSFQINSQSGLITTTKRIDRETTSTFQLTVVARDSGSPRMLSTAVVSVTIVDENDNSPTFNPTSYPVSLREDIPVNQNVIQVVATDADQPMTSNSNIAYSIISGNIGSAFRIESNGQIKVNQMLDYETTPSYNLKIQARDSGTPQMSNTATVTVTVVNVNENPPTLSGDQSVSISESAPSGSTVAIFRAQDQDQMAVMITITAGNSEGKFSIAPTTGVITLASQLNYEVTNSYSLTITASDGAQTTSSTLTVTVEDANEFTPSFTAPFSFTVQEQLPANSIVGTVSATDGDRGAVVTYRFVTNDQTTSKFSLDSRSGRITTASVLDREVLEQIFTPPSSRVTVQVSATDNGSPPRIAIRDYTITLTDINDNPPTFSSASYSAQLRENLPSGQTVFILDATDPDLGSNARISYSFTLTNNQGLPNPFLLNAASNSIVTSQELDYEVKSFYDFSIQATDAGNPPESSTVSGRLNVIDENDNSPVFTNSTYILYVGEDVLPGNTILTVRATDADSGTNGEVEYYITGQRVYTPIEGGYSETLFQIGRSSGDLSILNSFDFERSSVENLKIYANDKGSPQRTASATVMIFVRNVDEDPPYFPLSSSCDATVQEDISIGSFISNCTAIDPDSVMGGIQSSVTYSVTSSQFTIGRTTGEITSIAALDREQSSSYRIPVVATDSSGKMVTRETTITVTDVNDNAPAFSSSSYSYRFTDQDIRDHLTQFITIQATDADFGDNGRVSFYIGSVNTTERQSIVEVIAGDNGSPQLNSSVFVTVTYDSPCLIQVYSIDSSSGVLEARLMCSVAVMPSPTANLILGKAGSISCKVVSNLVTEYRWLQNGATVMRPGVLERGSQVATLSFATVSNSHAGDYSCKATSEVGSVQSSASKAAILVPPMIVSPPTDIAIRQGNTATFTCSAVGDPPPTVEWFRGTRRLSQGTTLSFPRVTSAEAGLYTCGVTSSAGTSTASARLIIFDRYNVVKLELTNINNPKSDGSCQFFNPSDIASTINSATGQRVLVADLSGSNICENSACSPNPCKNRGECTVNDQAVGGFVCSCKRGFTGTTCNTDVDECTQSPCGMNGNCVNTRGSFNCNCFANRTGRVCEYRDLCSSMPCNSSAGECLESTSLGYVCEPVQKDKSVVVGTPKMSLFRLNELIQDFVYAQQRLALTQPSSNRTARRKRQASSSPPLLNTLCSPRFVVSGGDTVLLWVCPPGEPKPTPGQQQMLCQYLFDEDAVSQCTSPQGQLMTAPTSATVAPTSVVVEVVLLDQSNQPVDSKDSIKTIESSSAGSELSKQGVTLAAVQPETTEDRPDTNKPSNLPIIIGAAVGAVAGIAILIIVIILVYVIVVKKKRSYQEMKDKKKARAMQMIQREEKTHAESDTRNLIVNTSAEIDTSA